MLTKKTKATSLNKEFESNIKGNKTSRNNHFRRKIYNIAVLIVIIATTLAIFTINNTAESNNSKIETVNDVEQTKTSIVQNGINKSGLIYTIIPEEYKAIEQNSKLALYCNTETGSIIVENKETGYLWKATIDSPEDYALENLNEYLKKYMSSLLKITYTDIGKNKGSMGEAFSTADANITNYINIENGIKLDYDFSNIGIKISIEIVLDKDGLVMKIPSDKIKEDKNFGIISIELVPFFGAEKNILDGYIFYPDGSGAIMKYENSEKRPKIIKSYNSFVFSPEKVDIPEYINMEIKQEYNPMLPIYGIKNGDNAFLAIASKGAEETAILVYPYGYITNLNRASFEFYYRHFYKTILSNIKIWGKNTAKDLSGIKADKELIAEDHEVRIIFLDENDSNYSGMANAYREYLIKNGELRKAITDEYCVPMGVSLFMGIMEERILFNKYIPMTNFQQAEMIIKGFKEKGIDNLYVNLNGWSESGYGNYPNNWPPERKLGGITGIKKLVNYTSENDIRIFLQTNTIDAVTNNNTYSKRNDVIIQGNGLAVAGINKERFLLNPLYSYKRMQSLIKNITILDEMGLALEKVGKLVYPDYNKSKSSSRTQTIKIWEDIFHLAKEQKIPVAVEGGNAYVLKYADYLFNIPVMSSGYHITDETVPFFQMVVHGLIPYTSKPGNLAYDLLKQKLQWVEYGCMPFFELTYEDTVKLRHTGYNKLFNSQYENWLDAAENIYKEFNERLNRTWGEQMVKHERLNSDLVRVTYSNQVVIYINYSQKEITYDGYKIKAQDYLVIDEKGETR